MPTIAHISDLHLQSGVPERQAQVEPILKKINEMKPDLVVISGDVTDDGWESIDELRWAKDWLEERIDGEWFAVPGNHDVGNFASLSEGQINDERVANWEQVFGKRRLFNLDGWKIIGVNSMLFGSGIDAEQTQADWLHETLVFLDMRYTKVAIFLHSPLLINEPMQASNRDSEYWLGPFQPRSELMSDLNGIDHALLVASGHVHQSNLIGTDHRRFAWAPPASGTWVHAPGLPNPPMPEKTGFFLHTLHDDGRVGSELITCAPMLKCIEFNPWP